MNDIGKYILVLVLFQAGLALARDVATEQYATTAALEAMQKAKSEYETDAGQVKLYKQRIAEEQKQLVIAEKKAAASKARYLEAKARYGKKQAALDRAWGK